MSATEAKKSAKILRKSKEKYDVTVEMLLGPNGLTLLAEKFEKIHSNMNYGKGLEFHNLNLLLKEYEMWATQLSPGLDVDVFVERCEKLSGHDLIRQTLDNANGRMPKRKKDEEPNASESKRKKKKKMGMGNTEEERGIVNGEGYNEANREDLKKDVILVEGEADQEENLNTIADSDDIYSDGDK